MKKRVLLFAALLIYILFSFGLVDAARYLNESNVWQQNIVPVNTNSFVFGDLDLDADLDIVLSGGNGSMSIKVYLNNGSSYEENQTWQQNLEAIYRGSLALGDLDLDGDLDLVLSGYNGTIGINKVYLNNGTSFVENQTWHQNLEDINPWGSSIALGDIDNDGDLDMALTGTNSTANNGIYLNNGSSFVRNSTWLASMPLVGQTLGNGVLAFGDLDNDDRLDLVFVGSEGTNFYAKVYINNGTSLIENTTFGGDFVEDQYGWPSLSLGDYDTDGDMDLFVMGTSAGDHCTLYINNGTTFVQNESEYTGLCGIFDGSLAVGDYDNDGDLDLLSTGKEGDSSLSINNDRDFVYDNTESFYMLNLDDAGYINWIDVDNDTDLDVIEVGVTAGGTYTAKVYLSNRSLTQNNTQPAPPNSSFSETYINDKLTLSWGNGSDNETPTAGLYYNLRVGNCSGCHNIVSGAFGGSSNPTAGYFGNMMQRKSITLSGDWLQANTTYYWSVQTIDTGLAKSAWSEEQNYSTAEQEIVSPDIVLNEPADSNYTSFDNITFNATVWDNVNVSNVSLHGSWDGWHRNQTNSSGLNGTDYLLQANLSGYAEGTYTWAIHSCDTSGNCRYSENRTIIRDLYAPLVMLDYPANESTWTASNTMNFSFNVTDLAIQNCSLIIGSSLKYNLTSVVVNTSTNITLDLANGDYVWHVNCTDMLQRLNSSARRQLTVNYQAPSEPSAPSGGGGGLPSKIYELGELQEAEEINKAMKKGDKILFSIQEEEHKLEVKKVLSNSVFIEINSTPFNFTLGINESKRLNLSTYDFYDLFVKLNSIINFKANLTLRAIHEVIPSAKPPEEENITKEEIEKEEKPAESIDKKEEAEGNYWWVGSGLAAVAVVAGLVSWLRRKLS